MAREAGTGSAQSVAVCNTIGCVAGRLSDLDLLDDEDLFEIVTQAAHLFERPKLGIDDIREVRAPIRFSTPLNRPRPG
jgi:hypothetical protein